MTSDSDVELITLITIVKHTSITEGNSRILHQSLCTLNLPMFLLMCLTMVSVSGSTDLASLKYYRSTTSLIVAMPFSPTYYWLTIGLQIVHHTLSYYIKYDATGQGIRLVYKPPS